MRYRRIQMRARFSVAWMVILASLATPRALQADQRRDYMLTALPAGDRLYLDYLGTGARVTLEHRRRVLTAANDYTVSGSALLGYPLGQVEASAALRVLWFEFGASLGYRTLWRNLSFAPGDDGSYCKACDRASRRARDAIFDGGSGTDKFAFAEGRIQFYAPFNEYFVFTSLFALRYEGRAPRSYDWFFTNIHDAGVMARWEAVALLKHRRWGGIGPYLMLNSVPRDGHHESEFALGFNAMTRLGLVDRNDMLFITFLTRPGDDVYGVHSYFAPIRALIVYRLQLSL